jgi:hypothetical protein
LRPGISISSAHVVKLEDGIAGTIAPSGAFACMSQACLPDVVRVTVHEEPTGLLVAVSPDLPGPIAVAFDADRLSRSLPERIRAWFEAEGCDVIVARGEGRVTALSSWNVVPRIAADDRGARDPVPQPNPPPPLPPSIDPSRPEGHPPPPPPIPVPDLPPPGKPPPSDPDPTR